MIGIKPPIKNCGNERSSYMIFPNIHWCLFPNGSVCLKRATTVVGRAVLLQLYIYARWSSRHEGRGCPAPMTNTKHPWIPHIKASSVLFFTTPKGVSFTNRVGTWILNVHVGPGCVNTYVNPRHAITPLCLCFNSALSPLIARFMGRTWGPPGANRTQMGPMLAPWTLLSGQCMECAVYTFCS